MPAFVFPHTETVMQGGNHSIYLFQRHIFHPSNANTFPEASSLGCSRLKTPFDYDPSHVYRFEEFEAFNDWMKTHDFEALGFDVVHGHGQSPGRWQGCARIYVPVGIPRFPFQVTYFCLITSNPSLLLRANPAPSPAPARPWSKSSSNLLCLMWPNFRYVDIASCGGCFCIQNTSMIHFLALDIFIYNMHLIPEWLLNWFWTTVRCFSSLCFFTYLQWGFPGIQNNLQLHFRPFCISF